VYVTLPLFASPGQELSEGPVGGGKLRALADDLRDRLRTAADVVDRLTAAGWSASAAAHDVLFQPAGVGTREEARERLLVAGLDPEDFMIVEEVDEE